MKKLLILSIAIQLYATDYKELLFHGNCITCHFIDRSVSAPSMRSVQEVYKDAFPNKKEFIEYMSSWAEHPNKEGSLMHYAIDKYELMPELGFDKDTLMEISDYIYNLR